MTERTIAKITALKKLSTLKPLTICDASITSTALITNVKSPKVRALIGSVSTKRTGFINAFRIPNTKAATRAAEKLLTSTPGSM